MISRFVSRLNVQLIFGPVQRGHRFRLPFSVVVVFYSPVMSAVCTNGKSGKMIKRNNNKCKIHIIYSSSFFFFFFFLFVFCCCCHFFFFCGAHAYSFTTRDRLFCTRDLVTIFLSVELSWHVLCFTFWSFLHNPSYHTTTGMEVWYGIFALPEVACRFSQNMTLPVWPERGGILEPTQSVEFWFEKNPHLYVTGGSQCGWDFNISLSSALRLPIETTKKKTLRLPDLSRYFVLSPCL